MEKEIFEPFENPHSNNYSNFYSLMDNLEDCNISSISVNSNYSNYNFICKQCGKIPKIISFKKKAINIICSCSDSLREISISNFIFDNLNNSENDNNLPDILHCSEHKKEKIMLYCKNAKKIYVINV